MADDPRILRLVEEALDSRLTPEEVCAKHPELLADVKQYLTECKILDFELEDLFPSSGTGTSRGEPSAPERLPAILGYEVLKLIGRGGIGVIYQARHLKLNRIVALKMLLSGQFASRIELERFTREAQA